MISKYIYTILVLVVGFTFQILYTEGMICLWQGKVWRVLLVSYKFASSSPAGGKSSRLASSTQGDKGDDNAKTEKTDSCSRKGHLSRKRGHITPASRLTSLLPHQYWQEEASEAKEVIEKVAGSLLIENTQTEAHHHESENGKSGGYCIMKSGNTSKKVDCKDQGRKHDDITSQCQVEPGTIGSDRPDFRKYSMKPDMTKFNLKTEGFGFESSKFHSLKSKTGPQQVKFQRRRGSLNVAGRLAEMMKANIGPDSDGGQRKE